MLGRILASYLISKKKIRVKLYSRNKSKIKRIDKRVNFLKIIQKKYKRTY